jgi:hypothetical protein
MNHASHTAAVTHINANSALQQCIETSPIIDGMCEGPICDNVAAAAADSFNMSVTVNILSLNYMLKVATVIQGMMAKLNGADPDGQIIVIITRIVRNNETSCLVELLGILDVTSFNANVTVR